MNKHGFTLMEVLAVLLILAVVVSFALPGIRLIRDEVRHSQAKSAASKMAEAMRSFYQDTKGFFVVGCVQGKGGTADCTNVLLARDGSCNAGTTGIPSAASGGTVDLGQLFACDYLSTKDFAGLPYKFKTDKTTLFENEKILVKATGTSDAGRHHNDTWCVFRDSSIAKCN